MRQLVRANSRDLLSYFARRVPSTDDAADLVSETMVTVWRRVASVPDDDTEARMWMFGVARRVLADHSRSGTRRSRLAERLREELALRPLVVSDDLAFVWDAVQALPERQREIVLLVHGDGFSLAEAAQLIHTSGSTIRSRYAAALAALHRSLAHDDARPVSAP